MISQTLLIVIILALSTAGPLVRASDSYSNNMSRPRPRSELFPATSTTMSTLKFLQATQTRQSSSNPTGAALGARHHTTSFSSTNTPHSNTSHATKTHSPKGASTVHPAPGLYADNTKSHTGVTPAIIAGALTASLLITITFGILAYCFGKEKKRTRKWPTKESSSEKYIVDEEGGQSKNASTTSTSSPCELEGTKQLHELPEITGPYEMTVEGYPPEMRADRDPAEVGLESPRPSTSSNLSSSPCSTRNEPSRSAV